MFKYILKRILMMIPTLVGITLLTFVIVNLAPGGPIEQKIQKLRFNQSESGKGPSVISEEVLENLKKQYGFDKPLHVRYLLWLKNVSVFNFGESFTYEEPVIDIIVSKLPVSIQFGLSSFILSYFVCISLGLMKAMKHNSVFDHLTSVVIFVAYSIPGFMLAILLIVFFAGGNFYSWFPIGQLYSDNYQDLDTWGKIIDRLHHFVLPLICYMIGSFTVLTVLMKNSLLDEIKKDYIRTARAKGLSENGVILKHALKNALIPIATGIGGFFSIFFAGSLLLENIFQLDGMGQLFYQSILQRDYNVIMGLLFIQSLLMMLGNIVSDLAYVFLDPRINFD